MSRRHQAEKRKIEEDPLYRSKLLGKFVNKVMVHGKKSLARRLVHNAILAFAEKVGHEDPLQAFEEALENIKPALEVKARRIGGATYQVPVEIPQERRIALAMRWLIYFSRKKSGSSMERGLMLELTDSFRGQGASVKKKEDTHRMAESNKAYAHYKW